MEILTTRHGIRLRHHGAVISEVRTRPGPTHSVFDVLAAAVAIPAGTPRVAVLGFAAGGLVAPLVALNPGRRFDAIDLDRDAYSLFRRHCPAWTDRVRWHHREAGAWLRQTARRFDLIVEDLSVDADGDIVKPQATWKALPSQIRRRLRPGGWAVFNLLPPGHAAWSRAIRTVAAPFPAAVVVHIGGYLNRIVIASDRLPESRRLGADLRHHLDSLGSRLARRIRLSRISTEAPHTIRS